MKIVIAGDGKFRNMVCFAVQKAEEFGYEPLVYDLGGLGFGKKFDIDPVEIGVYGSGITNSYFKPRLIQDAFDGENFLVWLDADAFIIKPIEGVMADDYDVGVTMRRQSERGQSPYPHITGYLNAGVIFFSPTAKCGEFIDKWEARRLRLAPPNDQYALNELVREATDLTEYDKVFVRDDGIRIKVFRCTEYNYYYVQEGVSDEAKILHIKSNLRGVYAKYRDKYTPGGKP